MAERYNLHQRETATVEEAIGTAYSVWRVLRALIDVPEESMQNMGRLNEHLDKGSVVMYWHHLGKADALFGPIIVRALLDERLKRAVGPVRIKQYQGIQRAGLDWLGRKLRIHAMPVVGIKDTGYESIREELNGKYLIEVGECMKESGCLLGIGPGGTRSRILPSPDKVKTSYLIYGMGEYGEVLYVPAVLSPVGCGRQRLAVGEPFFLRELGVDMAMEDDQELRGALAVGTMKRLAMIVPRE